MLEAVQTGLVCAVGAAVPLSAHVPDLSALQVPLGVARTGSLNGAARQAGVGRQAVSARICAMEAQTGVARVHRTHPYRVNMCSVRLDISAIGSRSESAIGSLTLLIAVTARNALLLRSRRVADRRASAASKNVVRVIDL